MGAELPWSTRSMFSEYKNMEFSVHYAFPSGTIQGGCKSVTGFTYRALVEIDISSGYPQSIGQDDGHLNSTSCALLSVGYRIIEN